MVVPTSGALRRSCSRSPATRISKNSSRLLLTMHKKRSRSSSGIDGSSASASTRRSNARIESSRLIACGSGSLTGGGLGLGAIEDTVDAVAGAAATGLCPASVTDMLRSGRFAGAARLEFERKPEATALRLSVELGQIGAVQSQLVGRRCKHTNWRQRGRAAQVHRGCGWGAELDRERLLAAGHRQIHFREQLCVKQRAVQCAVRVRYSKAFTQSVQGVLLSRELLARERERIDDLGADRGGRGQVEALELFVEKRKIERRVVDNPHGSTSELDELAGNIGELRLLAQRLPGQAVDVGRTCVNLAFRVQVEMHVAAGRTAIDDLDAGDFDHPVTLLG